jgi:hypothetical protein
MLRTYRCQCNKCLIVSFHQSLKSGFMTWTLLDNSQFTCPRGGECDDNGPPSRYPTDSRDLQNWPPSERVLVHQRQ